MSIFSNFVPARQSFARAALFGTVMFAAPLTAPLTAAYAQTAPVAKTDTAAPAATMAQPAAPKTHAGAAATSARGETVEQRIVSLRAALKITPDEDAKWSAVAQSMRENAAAMDKLIAEGRTTAPGSMTAVDDLKMYQKFSQAHIDGLKNLTASFATLYTAMPDAQKKIADGVFESAHQTRATNG